MASSIFKASTLLLLQHQAVRVFHILMSPLFWTTSKWMRRMANKVILLHLRESYRHGQLNLQSKKHYYCCISKQSECSTFWRVQYSEPRQSEWEGWLTKSSFCILERATDMGASSIFKASTLLLLQHQAVRVFHILMSPIFWTTSKWMRRMANKVILLHLRESYRHGKLNHQSKKHHYCCTIKQSECSTFWRVQYSEPRQSEWEEWLTDASFCILERATDMASSIFKVRTLLLLHQQAWVFHILMSTISWTTLMGLGMITHGAILLHLRKSY